MKIRRGFEFIDPAEVVTPVKDHVGLFVPDQSLSVRDIITRFAITGDVSALRQAVERGFDGDDDFDEDGFTDLASMDIAELQELSDRAAQILNDYRAARNDLAKSAPAPAPVETPNADA